MSIEPYVYPPRDREEVERRLDEHYANLACRDGMEEIIRNSFDGARLDSNTNHRRKVGDTHAARAGVASHRPVLSKNQFYSDLSYLNWFFV